MSYRKPIEVRMRHGYYVVPDETMIGRVCWYSRVFLMGSGRTIYDLMMAGFCCLLMVGCGPLTADPTKPVDPQPSVIVDHGTSADVWEVLAVAVSKSQITTPQRLAQYVSLLRKYEDLSADDVTKFNGQFPKASTDESTLDPASAAAKIRGLK